MTATDDDDVVSNDLCVLANTGAIHTRFKNYQKMFRTYFKKRAFLHWYEQEGCTIADFNSAINDMNVLSHEYENFANASEEPAVE